MTTVTHEPASLSQTRGQHAPPESFSSTPPEVANRDFSVSREESGETRLPSADIDGIRLFSVKELASALGQTERWVYRQVEERGMPAIRLGRALVFQLPPVLGWLERQRVGDWTDGTVGDGR